MSTIKDVSQKFDKMMDHISTLKEDSAYTRGVIESILKDQSSLKKDVAEVKAEQNKMKGGIVVISAITGLIGALFTKLFK